METGKSPYERKFWERFPELLIDDPKDEYYELISLIRITVLSHFIRMCQCVESITKKEK